MLWECTRRPRSQANELTKRGVTPLEVKAEAGDLLEEWNDSAKKKAFTRQKVDEAFPEVRKAFFESVGRTALASYIQGARGKAPAEAKDAMRRIQQTEGRYYSSSCWY